MWKNPTKNWEILRTAIFGKIDIVFFVVTQIGYIVEN